MNSMQAFQATGNGTSNFHESSAVPERRRPTVGLPVRILKAFLLLAAWADFVWWISLWYRMPSTEGKAFKKKVSLAVASTFWGKYG